MYGPVEECHCGCPEFSVAGCYANVHCWAQSLVIRVLKDLLLYPPQPSLLSCAGANRTPFLHHTAVLWCEKSNLFFLSERMFWGSSMRWSPTLSLCTHARQHPPLFCSAQPFCTSIFFPFSTYLFFSFPPFPVGTSMFYVSLKGSGPRRSEQCSLRGFLNVSELLTLHVSLFWSVKCKLLNNWSCIIQTWWGKRQGFYENQLRLAMITGKWYLFQIRCDL